MSHPGYPFLVYVWGRPSLMAGPVLGILASKRLSCGQLWPAVLVYQSLRALVLRQVQASGLQEDNGERPLGVQRLSARLEKSESCWNPSQPAHIRNTILGSLMKCRSVTHTSRGDDESQG